MCNSVGSAICTVNKITNMFLENNEQMVASKKLRWRKFFYSEMFVCKEVNSCI